MNDIEIYIRDPAPKAIEAWLQSHFEYVELAPFPAGKGFKGHVGNTSQKVPVKLFMNAVGKYASLLLESPDTPWQNDLSCARDAWQALGKEVRCATGEWQENAEVEEDLWWVLNEEGEKQIRWHG